MDGKKLQRLRTEKGYSITKLSLLTGISKSYLSLLEREIQTNPGLEVLDRISGALEIPVELLISKESEDETAISATPTGKSKLKVEIELSEGQLSPQKLQHIKELIDAINNEV
ncbi:helix-turn-helix domain-containing protein [Neobacillus citreus]|uniref:Helix-turn-helix domain-containing protein n=1 Tax=Neobacillus citreus TaxID=2833578 RepID=A0A942T3C5_9BACI|nr:helix-turn-helix transcriptional regulator [Neobacillus citreus]MCH6267623.1 helix-turn-helix domain-containing protein [Neobacillus citreus]